MAFPLRSIEVKPASLMGSWMRRILLVFAALAAIVSATGLAQADPQTRLAIMATPVAMGAGIIGPAQNLAGDCHRAWRCGPAECGWRAVCTWAGWRPSWRSHEPWRHHQWRRHYW